MSTLSPRQTAIVSAVAALVGEHPLAALTTQAIATATELSEGGLFRHFRSKGEILIAYLEGAAARLEAILSPLADQPPEFALDRLAAALRDAPDLGNLLLNHQGVEGEVAAAWQAIQALLERFLTDLAKRSDLPAGVQPKTYLGELKENLRRAVVEDEETHLPWQPSKGLDLPELEVLGRLALNPSGFVFDPVTGVSLTANGPGLALLRHWQGEPEPTLEGSVAVLTEGFEVDRRTAERDILDYAALVREALPR
ncbi:MAG: hypothetical protein COX57_04480 [Alphaproteobacteria bacterium CG_4_10_14_0_2_um_filter_63_37]|nr:MAG: hypothetical protein COX57_04480 [Alphaproteobacteria bacterium CG_4_10_14_0_2_um_filter_63_37]